MTQTLHFLLKAQACRISAIIEEVEKATVGKRARIVSKYNGQPYGRSRPSQQGRIVTVARATFNEWNNTFSFKVKEERLYLDMEELEFLK